MTDVSPNTAIETHRGRPLRFKTPEEFEAQAMEYVAECKRTKEPITITGLAMALHTTRQVLMDYARRDEFTDAVKRVKQIAENYAETQGYKGKSPIFAIFALKNFGWKDKQEVEHSVKSIANVLNELEGDDEPPIEVEAQSIE